MKYLIYPTLFIIKSIYNLYSRKIFKFIFIYILIIYSNLFNNILIPVNIEKNILLMKPIQICELNLF